MTTETPTATDLVLSPEQTHFNQYQVRALVQLGVDPNTHNADLAIFFHQAKRTGLDPFSKQIYMISRNAYNNRTKSYEVKNTIQTGIDGYRLIARRAADKAKVDFDYGPTQWLGEDGEWRDYWDGGRLIAARVTLFKGDANKQYPAIAHYSEYVQLTRDGSPNSMWAKMAASQLAKCAEALALRKAFPLDLSGIYTDEEMDQATNGFEDMGEQISGAPAPAAADAPTQKVGRKPRAAPRAKPEPNTPEPEAHAPEAQTETAPLEDAGPEADSDGVVAEADPSAPDPSDPAEPPADYGQDEAEPDEGPAAALEDLGEKNPEPAPEKTPEPDTEAAPKAAFKACTPGQFRKIVELAQVAYPEPAAMKAALLEFFRKARGDESLAELPAGHTVVSRDEAAALTAELQATADGVLPVSE